MKRCAIYTRVSTSNQAEQEYNSCEAQRDKILSYVKSQEDLEIAKECSDPGFSGSNLERPALQDLLRDIQKRQIDVVLTYKIDRLTRSSRDFYALIELFEKYGVSFVSVTERFDTSSPSGRLLRNIMLTFAQFEREMTAERTRDKMIQRAERGLWNGRAPFGYKLIEKKLVPDNKRVKIVRKIFECFAMTGSLKKAFDLAREISALNPDTGMPLTLNGIFHILRNPTYIGKMVWGGKIYQSNHEPIISKELFEHAQSLTMEKPFKKRLYKEYLLAGLLKCAECGSTMTPTFSNKKARRYYYYKCYKVVREGKAACGIKEVSAERLEEFLIEHLSRIAQDRQYIENLAFKMAHRKGGPAGFELKEESSKDLEKSLSETLGELKKKLETGTQIERALILRKKIRRITFGKESLEVIVSLTDIELGRKAARIPANPFRPADARADAAPPPTFPQFEAEIW